MDADPAIVVILRLLALSVTHLAREALGGCGGVASSLMCFGCYRFNLDMGSQYTPQCFENGFVEADLGICIDLARHLLEEWC